MFFNPSPAIPRERASGAIQSLRHHHRLSRRAGEGPDRFLFFGAQLRTNTLASRSPSEGQFRRQNELPSWAPPVRPRSPSRQLSKGIGRAVHGQNHGTCEARRHRPNIKPDEDPLTFAHDGPNRPAHSRARVNFSGRGQVTCAPAAEVGGREAMAGSLSACTSGRRTARRRLVEPFCGGLAVTLGLMPTRAIVNDINPHVINFYSWLRRGLTISLPMVNQEQAYYLQRARFNEILAKGEGRSREAAGLFYYLNRTGYNGLCRFNRSGEFNVPFGRYTRITYARDFNQYREIFNSLAVPLRRLRNDQARSGGFCLRGSAVRCRVHELCQGRLHLGRAGASRRAAR